MNDLNVDKKKRPKLPLSFRLKYMFSGYKQQLFFNSLRKIAPICIIAIIIVLVVVYIFLHPIDKIKLRYFFTRDCTIKAVSGIQSTNGNLVGPTGITRKVLVDGDWIKSGNNYYNLVDGEWYCYYKDAFGKWQKYKYEIDISSSMGAKLLDKDNYVRDKKNPFVWILKEEVYEKTFTMSNVRIERAYGCIAIVGEEYYNGLYVETAICFKGFGTTYIELPWED